MAVNRFYQGTPYQASLYTPPVEFIGKALEAAQQQYEVNYEIASKLRDTYVNARTPDKPRAAEKMKEYSDQIDNIVAKYNGDYSQATGDLRGLIRNVKKDFGPNGEMGAIQNNYNIEKAALEAGRKRLGAKENGTDNIQLNAMKAYYDRVGATTFDKDKGTWSTVASIDLPNAYDIPKNFEEYIAKVPERTVEDMVPTQDMTMDGYHVFEKVKYSGKDYNEAKQGWRAMLNNDLQFQAYAQSLAQLSGIDPSEFSETILKDYDQNILPGRTGFTQVGREYQFIRDYKGEELFKAKMKAAAEGSGADISKDGSAVTSRLKVANTGRPAPQLAPEKEYLGDGSTWGAWAALLQQHPDSYGGMTSEQVAAKARKPPAYSDLMTSPKYSNLNRDRLKSIKDANPNMSDLELVKAYNLKEEENQWHTAIQYVAFNTSSGQQEAADKLLPGLKAGGYRVYAVKNETGEIAEIDSRELYETLAVSDDASKGIAKSKQPALGFAMGFTNHVPTGSIMIADPAGDVNTVYAIAPARADFKNAQERVIKQLMQPLIERRAKSSLPVQFTTAADGTPSYIASKLSYMNGDEVVTFHKARWNAQGQPELDPDPILAEDGSVLGPQGMEMFLMKDLFREIIPRDSVAMFKAEKLMLNNS